MSNSEKAVRPAAALEGVTKRFANGVLALSNMSLRVEEREFLSLLGPSGCGKSTVLRLIAGLETPSSGKVALFDDDVSGPQTEIGFVFQEPTLMPWATAFDNVWLPLRLKGLSKASARADIMDALETVGLASFAGAYPRELSGGMKMRVSIARALVTRPRLLLMDEPFAALDEINRFRLNDDLLRLWEKFGWTVVFVTHSVFEAVNLSSRIAVMTARPGRVAADVPVAASYPRDAASRTSLVYSEQCREISLALQAAMDAREERLQPGVP